MTTDASPLTDREISWLESVLATPAFSKQSMGLDEIQGYLTAVLSGPERLPVSKWMPAVLGDPVFESDEQEQEIKSLLTRFHDEISADLNGGESISLVLDYAESADASGENEYDYAAWCQAYLDGVDASPLQWNEVLRTEAEEEELNELLFPISLLAGEIDPKAFKQIKPGELADVLKECRDDLPMLVVDIAKFFEKIRNRPKVTVKRPGSAAQDDLAKKKLH
jgi:uncharacterized protein